MNGFADIREYGEDIANTNQTRYFDGLGKPFLRVPGLRAGGNVYEVRINGHLMALSELRRYPQDAQGTHPQFAAMNYREVEQPLVMVDYADDGTPVLIRHEYSNDGMWQDGAKIGVKADWVPEVVAAVGEPSTQVTAAGRK